MDQLLRRLWADDAGALIASEYLFVSTILVIGTVVGLTSVRDAVNIQLSELANAFLSLNDSYSFSGASGSSGGVAGSQAVDTPAADATYSYIAPATPVNIEVTP